MFKVEIDHEKCQHPEECGKCLRTCPFTVLVLYPKSRLPWKMASAYLISFAFEDMCNGCKLCEDVCPTGAISVS
jgi:ferredoxin